MTSRYVKPRTYYLIALGLVAIAFEAGRRLLPRLGKEHEDLIIEGQAETVVPPARSAPRTTTPVYENGGTAAPAKKPASPKAKPAEKAAAADDLTLIKGIGPTYAKRLREAGLATYADVASATPDRLREVTKAATMTDVNEWIAQALRLRQN